MTRVNFTKMHGLGNDFMVIDNLEGKLKLTPSLIQAWSDRHTGIGFDQLLVVNCATVANAEFNYQIFNANGTEVEHCGNGARCFARFVTEKKLTDNSVISVNTLNGVITLRLLDDDQVTVNMGLPVFTPERIPFVADEESQYYDLQVGENHYQVGAVNIGNPHVLLRMDDINTAPVEVLGPKIESHERFPKRVNVGFMQVVDRHKIRLRVYERGVGETLACGSGACAAVAIAYRQGLLDKSATVTLPGGDLKVYWPNEHSSIEMTGPCSTVFEGQIRL